MSKKRYLILFKSADPYCGDNFEIVSARDFNELKIMFSFDWKYNCLPIIGVYDISDKINLKGRLKL